MPPLQDAFPRLLPLGDGAWTVEFGNAITPDIHGRVAALEALIHLARQQEPLFSGVVDVVPTFRSLSVYFRPMLTDGTALGQRLLNLAQGATASLSGGHHWCLPACFDAEFAPDLADVAERQGLSTTQVVEQLCTAVFRVYMIGFMPGFPYMGGLPEGLHTPRLPKPRTAVPARSIAIAGAMCAVYPWVSPGGWNLVGSIPLDLFLPSETPPALLASGDTVSWKPISQRDYAEIEAALGNGQLRRQNFLQEFQP